MAYSELVLADEPAYYWRLDAASGNESNQGSFGTATMNPGTTPPTQNVAKNASYTALNGKCWQFDGTNDYGVSSAFVELDHYQHIAVEFLLYWDAYGVDHDQAMELSATSDTIAGTFLIRPNYSTGAFLCQMNGQGPGPASGDYLTYGTFSRPSAAAWHHYVIDFNLGSGASDPGEINVYVDGAQVSFSTIASAAGDNLQFSGNPLYLMSRNGASLFGAGKLDEIAIYTSTGNSPPLDATQILRHYQGLTAVRGAVDSPFTVDTTTNGNFISVPSVSPLAESSLVFTPIT